MRLTGIKCGRTIEFIQELDLPDGAAVNVEVTVAKRDGEDLDRIRQLNALFGCWQNQPDLDEIFAVIDRERHE